MRSLAPKFCNFVFAELRRLNGLDSLPSPLLTAPRFTNQITGPATLKVTVTGVLVAGVPMPQPVSVTVYVKVTAPVTPAGGSKSNAPVDALVIVTLPPAG